MSKELDALERIKKIEIYKEEDYYNPDDERTIGLSGYEYQGSVEEEYANEIEIIETALKDYQELKQINIDRSKQMLDLVSEQTKTQNKLKALEIIKKKRVNLEYLKCCETYEQYCLICSYANEIDQEEYNLLKEVLL